VLKKRLPAVCLSRRRHLCANFSARQGTFAPCNSCWCGPCYQPLGVKEHPIHLEVDEDGDLLEDANDAERFLVARAGDHLMIPFQCEVCHFRKVMQGVPAKSLPRDQEILEIMRRANIDAFWSPESSTVRSDLGEAMRPEITAFPLGMPSMTPPMGPWPLGGS
jgi:hypothetical protein